MSVKRSHYAEQSGWCVLRHVVFPHSAWSGHLGFCAGCLRRLDCMGKVSVGRNLSSFPGGLSLFSSWTYCSLVSEAVQCVWCDVRHSVWLRQAAVDQSSLVMQPSPQLSGHIPIFDCFLSQSSPDSEGQPCKDKENFKQAFSMLHLRWKHWSLIN